MGDLLRYISSYWEFVHQFISCIKPSISFLSSFRFFFQYLAQMYIAIFFSTFIPVKIFTIRGECGYVCYCRSLSLILPSVELAGQKKKKKKKMATAGLETGTSWTRD